MIVGRCAVGKRPEAAQQVELLLARPRHVGNRLCPCQHRQQAQQQDQTLPLWRGSGRSSKMAQENNRLIQGIVIVRRMLHRLLVDIRDLPPERRRETEEQIVRLTGKPTPAAPRTE